MRVPVHQEELRRLQGKVDPDSIRHETPQRIERTRQLSQQVFRSFIDMFPIGSKRVMLKNNQEAKFRMVLQPISKVALSTADQANVAFDAFFTHILMHELMHGLGPHSITVSGRATTVRQEMKELSSVVEEAKADVSGLFALQFLVDRGKLDKAYQQTMYTTYLASMFRSIRFGLTEAHGRGVAIQLNYFLDHGGVTVAQDGTFTVTNTRNSFSKTYKPRQ